MSEYDKIKDLIKLSEPPCKYTSKIFDKGKQ